MPTYASVTTDLEHVHSPRELQRGETYLVRFKNSQRDYRTDLWVAVIIPDEFGATRNLNRRPNGVKPVEGNWTTPLSERVYPIYIPGRNSYRWTHVKDLFMLDTSLPAVFGAASERQDASLFRIIHRIANRKPEWAFWESMANMEMVAKGKRKRTLSLIFPDGYDDILGDDRSALEEAYNYTAQGSDESVATQSERPSSTRSLQTVYTGFAEPESITVPLVKKAQGADSSVPVLHDPILPSQFALFGSNSTNEKSDPSSNKTSGPELINQSAQDGDEKPTSPAKDAQVTSSQSEKKRLLSSRTVPKTKKPRKKAGHSSDPSAKGVKTPIFDLTFRAALEEYLLQKNESAKILTIFDSMVKIKGRPEADQIRQFLLHKEFAPRLVSPNEPSQLAQPATSSTVPEEPSYEVGDRYKMQRKWKLEAIGNADELQRQIVSFGRLYIQALQLDMKDLIHLITRKLQAAWNSYPGLYQLEPLLDVAIMAFRDPPMDELDELQSWTVHFLADTLDLILYACPQKFWVVMGQNPTLDKLVFKVRKDYLRECPDRFSDPPLLIQSRSVDRFSRVGLVGIKGDGMGSGQG